MNPADLRDDRNRDELETRLAVISVCIQTLDPQSFSHANDKAELEEEYRDVESQLRAYDEASPGSGFSDNYFNPDDLDGTFTWRVASNYRCPY